MSLFPPRWTPRRGAFISEWCHFNGSPKTFGEQLPQTAHLDPLLKTTNAAAKHLWPTS